MKWALASVVFLLAQSHFTYAQDVKVREEAVRLMERANLVSTPVERPSSERVDRFRVFSDSGVQEGSFSRVVIQGVGRREEWAFGNYHLLNVWTLKQVAVVGASNMIPAELIRVTRITPMNLVHFDGEDVIHTIVERDMSGHRAKCIEFDTIKGQQTQNNELCVDARSGVLLEEKLGAELIENDEFFPFAGALMPGKISYSLAGANRIEIAQSINALNSSEANVLAAPAGAELHTICGTFRRPFGISMPQPKAGNGGTDSDIMVRASVGVDGKVYETTVQSSERPDLNEEALALAKQWRFTPALCDGSPLQKVVEFSLHFQGR
jgi:TonB family protein